jgi:formyltetrahydrofolate deformylase
MIILIQCNDKVGLVANISNIIADTGLNIIFMREHVEKAEARFFTRIEAEGNTDAVILKQQFQSALPDSADVRINPMPEKKIIVLVTKEYHCSW